MFDIERGLLTDGAVAREPLMEPEPDGVFAEGLRLGPNAAAAGLAADGGCQFYLVCTGSLEQHGKNLPAKSMIHVEPREEMLELRAGAAGACVLALRFPRPTGRPGSNPAKLGCRNAANYHMRPDNTAGAR